MIDSHQPARQPKGIPTGGQFTASTRGEAAISLVSIPAQEFEVQAAPLRFDDAALSRIAADGSLTSVVAIPADQWYSYPDPEDDYEDEQHQALAEAQMAHTQPFWMKREVLAVHDGQVYVEVSNNLHVWAQDDMLVDHYNAQIEHGHAITPEKRAWLCASGHTTADGRRAVYDLDNQHVIWTDDGPMRVTPCCGASATGTGDADGAYVGCRSCYQPVDEEIGMPARLVAERDNDNTCVADDCDISLDDNEGDDGYCGSHADLVEAHEGGEHRVGEQGRRSDCPLC